MAKILKKGTKNDREDSLRVHFHAHRLTEDLSAACLSIRYMIVIINRANIFIASSFGSFM